MPEAYLNLPAHDRREVIAVARGISLRPPNHLEKDIYVVWTLNALFRSEIGQHLVFKGGTSLSKAYGVLDRFSEDVDLTYDIRAIAGDLVGDAADALPSSRSQEKRWTSAVRHRLTDWVAEQALKLIRAALVDDGVQATAAVNGDKIYIDYDPVTARSGYVSPRVTLEFGARSTGEPNAVRAVTTDISAYVNTVTSTPAHSAANLKRWGRHPMTSRRSHEGSKLFQGACQQGNADLDRSGRRLAKQRLTRSDGQPAPRSIRPRPHRRTARGRWPLDQPNAVTSQAQALSRDS